MSRVLPLYRPSDFSYRYIDRAADLESALAPLYSSDRLGIDTETTGLDPHCDRPRLLQIAAPNQPVIVIDLFKITEEQLQPVQQLLGNPALKIGHLLKFEIQMLRRVGVHLRGPLFDTHLAFKVWSAGLKRKASLAAVVARLLKQRLDKRMQRSNFGAASLSRAQIEYSAIDARVELDLQPCLEQRLRQAGLWQVARDIEFPCIPIVAQMEWTGMKLDLQCWDRLNATLAVQQAGAIALINTLRRADKLQLSLVPELTDTVNPNSPAQLLAALRAVGIPVASTSQKVLVPLANDYPIVRAILDYRRTLKTAGIFNTTLQTQIHPTTGRLHPDWYQYGARSGRITCKHPPLQTIPRDRSARACFVAEPGWCIVKGDYSQIELRIVAKLSRDRQLRQAYRQGQDIHLVTAALITQQSIAQLLIHPQRDQLRQLAKALNFGLIYGMSAAKLQAYAETKYGVRLTLDQARSFIRSFFQAYPGIRRWHEQIRRTVYARGLKEIRTLTGRRRRWRDRPRLNELFNTPVQGLNADILKLAAIRLASAIDRRQLQARIICLVHDEIVVECPEAEAQLISKLLRRCMIAPARPLLHPVPVQVDVKVGTSWAA